MQARRRPSLPSVVVCMQSVAMYTDVGRCLCMLEPRANTLETCRHDCTTSTALQQHGVCVVARCVRALACPTTTARRRRRRPNEHATQASSPRDDTSMSCPSSSPSFTSLHYPRDRRRQHAASFSVVCVVAGSPRRPGFDVTPDLACACALLTEKSST
ncbi:hypothetical protein FA09DRAFT_192689 [Tilletiopsis washingtonensis]|uniref:Uncharacterized protein n=1 Tax=Tilletiopsis washingtonensis TaxID=58919 RepID=A0A316ZHU2_9BASI|nr:hypothetical protein FA09DRAFT_192689 [Tilletiopsis washingtonensis]PWO00609.1 hypothetical protein FA09DRAFT_192689 [Tilletiopsis washingtonensis]